MRARRKRSPGFTLVELLVALSAGAAVAAAAIMLAKNGVKLLQEESRISYAELSAQAGIDALCADLALAGRKSPSNARIAPRLCAPAGLLGFPEGIRNLAPVLIEPAAAILEDAALNGMTPERITIAGDLDSGERFDLRAVVPGATGATLYLQPKSGAIRRIEAQNAQSDPKERLSEIFRAGRLLRIDGGNHEYYGVIKALSIIGKPIETIAISLAETPELPLFPASPLRCAARGFLSGKSVNVISRVRYELRHFEPGSPYATWIEPPNTVAGDERRTELVRVELDANDQEMEQTLRIVAEHAVDLRFGITALDPQSQSPQLLRLPISDMQEAKAAIYSLVGPSSFVSGDPSIVRAVSVRLSVRSRAPDRKAPPLALPKGDGEQPYRFEVGKAMGNSRFARLRTLEREVVLKNLRDRGQP